MLVRERKRRVIRAARGWWCFFLFALDSVRWQNICPDRSWVSVAHLFHSRQVLLDRHLRCGHRARAY